MSNCQPAPSARGCAEDAAGIVEAVEETEAGVLVRFRRGTDLDAKLKWLWTCGHRFGWKRLTIQQGLARFEADGIKVGLDRIGVTGEPHDRVTASGGEWVVDHYGELVSHIRNRKANK